MSPGLTGLARELLAQLARETDPAVRAELARAVRVAVERLAAPAESATPAASSSTTETAASSRPRAAGRVLRMRSPVVLWTPEDGAEARKVDELLGELFERSNREHGASFNGGKARRDARFYPLEDAVRPALADVLFKEAKGYRFETSPGALFWSACTDPTWKHEEFAAANLEEVLERASSLRGSRAVERRAPAAPAPAPPQDPRFIPPVARERAPASAALG